MLSLGPMAFLNPWLLAGLIALPILWWLLRAIPPSPTRRAFPGVRLLLGLQDPERMPDRTPWWLLALRIGALAAAIFAFAEPILNPRADRGGNGPMLVLMDGGWASATDWGQRQARLDELLVNARRDGRPVALINMSEPLPETLPLRDARDWGERIGGLVPAAWGPDRAGFVAWLGTQDEDFDTIWLSDGLGDVGPVVEALSVKGSVTVIAPEVTAFGVKPAVLDDGALVVDVLRSFEGPEQTVTLNAIGPDPTGVERVLGSAEGTFSEGAQNAEIRLEMPLELRNRVSRITLPQALSAGAVTLADDTLRRRRVALISGGQDGEEQDFLQPLHYLEKALIPSAELIQGAMLEVLAAQPDVLILADVGKIADAEAEELLAWIERGGLLVRFAGSRLASSGAGQLDDDPFLPVRLRAGGRNIGGAMSWGSPKQLKPFPEGSPFFGLALPGEVDVSSQVVAQPDPDLPDRIMAALEDGTPLVTGRTQGDGRVVLFHVTANAEWSSLPLSGLFVQMLERLAISARVDNGDVADRAGRTWTAERVLNGFGTLVDPGPLAGVPGADMVEPKISATLPPGLYSADEQAVAVNVLGPEDTLTAAQYGGDVTMAAMVEQAEAPIKPWLLMLALLLLAADILGTLWIGGRLSGPRVAKAAAVLLAVGLAVPQGAQAQSDASALLATNDTVLAYVVTGSNKVDTVSEAGLFGLSQALFRRTAIEPIDPVAVNLEQDELAFYPFLYWPVTEGQALPSDEAYAKLNTYLRSGGMILFDTQDAHISAGGSTGTPNGRMLQRLAAKLDVPPLERIPEDHVLTRTFYLLNAFPGRWANGAVWVEAAPNAQEVEGMPFRNLNDGVTPIIVGGNDWASAWATDPQGRPVFPVGRGVAGERQREIAMRFGVNLIMHVMTGNYKSDQVHVPALLDRLGQ